MPALPTVVTDYLTAIKSSLSTGSDLGSSVRGAALNYLRAQDMATVLDLLQDAMDQTATMTVVDGTASSLQDGVQSVSALTFTGLAVNAQTVTIGTKVYTWEDTLTDVDGNVLVGASAAAGVANLVSAITLGAGAGTTYATSTTIHPDVTAIDDTGDVVTVTANLTGVAGDLIAIAENGTNMSWTGGDTFLGGVTAGVDAFGPEELSGNIVVFAAATTTVALRSVEARVASNTAGRLTFAADLPATPVAGDTYTMRGGWFDGQISDLREAKTLADSPTGSVYGDARSVTDALVTGIRRRGTNASQTLTFTGLALDTQTVVLGARTYTWQDTLTDTDGNVQIAGTAEGCIDNLVAAINLTGVAGTDYAASQTIHATAVAEKTSATVMTARARLVGTGGDALVTTETGTNTAWTAATLAGGANGGSGTVAERNVGHPSLEVGTGSTDTVVVLESLGVTYRIDQFRGMKVVVGAEAPRIISTSDGTTITVAPALSSAPTATTAVAITVPSDDVGGTSAPKIRTHPGAQPGEGIVLSDLIAQLQVLMESYVLPV